MQVPQQTPVFTSALLGKSGFEGLVQGNWHRYICPLGALSLSVCSKDSQRPTRADVSDRDASLVRFTQELAEAVVPEAGLLHCLLHGVQPTSFPLILVVLGWPDVLPPKVALPTVLADVCLCGARNRG